VRFQATARPAISAAKKWGTPLVVKRGAAGALVVDGGTVAEIRDGVQAARVRDLTGAGDAFAGALIAELLRGVPLTSAVVAANMAGSEAVGRLGAVGPVEMELGNGLGELLTGALTESVVPARIQARPWREGKPVLEPDS
jgi:sugar/nucleoside kinase (ribokinase family)